MTGGVRIVGPAQSWSIGFLRPSPGSLSVDSLRSRLRCGTTLQSVVSSRNFLRAEEPAVGSGADQSKLTEPDPKGLP